MADRYFFSDGPHVVPPTRECPELRFAAPRQGSTRGWLRIETMDLSFQEWINGVQRLRVNGVVFHTGSQFSVWNLLTNRRVLLSRANHALFVPLRFVSNEDDDTTNELHIVLKPTPTDMNRTTALENEEAYAKLMAAKYTVILSPPVAEGRGDGEHGLPEARFVLTVPQRFDLTDEKQFDSATSTWRGATPLFRPGATANKVQHVAQAVFYSAVTAMTWIESGSWTLLDANGQPTLERSIREPFEATTLDKHNFGLPVPQLPVFTATFSNYQQPPPPPHGAACLPTAHAVGLTLQLKPQFMPAAPFLETWCVVARTMHP